MDLGGTLLGNTDGSILIIEFNQFWFCFVWGPHPAVLLIVHSGITPGSHMGF